MTANHTCIAIIVFSIIIVYLIVVVIGGVHVRAQQHSIVNKSRGGNHRSNREHKNQSLRLISPARFIPGIDHDNLEK